LQYVTEGSEELPYSDCCEGVCLSLGFKPAVCGIEDVALEARTFAGISTSSINRTVIRTSPLSVDRGPRAGSVRMPVIATPACTDRGGNTTPITLPWTSFPLTVPNSTRSSECGSSPAVAACTIATLTVSKTSSARLNPSSQPGPLGTMSRVDYAQLLKTLRLVSHSRLTARPFRYHRHS
jgi:hypothetical protein